MGTRTEYMKEYRKTEKGMEVYKKAKEKYNKSDKAKSKKQDNYNSEYRKEYYKNNKEHVKSSGKERYDRLKRDVIEHYGGKCSCCGESEFIFLCVDHINNNGNEHRKVLKSKSGYSFYLWIKRNEYPDDLQILCWNCNSAKSILGKCPHQDK